jgi:hypothetical protein
MQSIESRVSSESRRALKTRKPFVVGNWKMKAI